MEQIAVQYGSERRRLRVFKMRDGIPRRISSTFREFARVGWQSTRAWLRPSIIEILLTAKRRRPESMNSITYLGAGWIAAPAPW